MEKRSSAGNFNRGESMFVKSASALGVLIVTSPGGNWRGAAIKQVENAGAFYFGHLVLVLLLFAAR
jgi:hypothetical protein